MRLFILIFLILITGCSQRTGYNSVQTIHNESNNEPSLLTMDEIYSLDSTKLKNPASIRFDSKGNIYVLEYRSKKLKILDGQNFELKDSVYSPENNVISSFSYFNGKIVMNCKDKRQLHIINADNPEEILRSIEFSDEIPNRIEIMPEGSFFGCFTSNLSGRDDTFWGYDLKMVDSDLKTVKLLSSFFGSYHEGNIDPEIPLFPFAVDRINMTVFAAVSSEKYYRIFAYDTEMNLKFIMDNSAERTKFTDSEKKRLTGLTIKFRLMPFKGNEKTLIESMTTDSDGNLWVRKAHNADTYGENSAVIDVFDPYGKYIDTYLVENVPRIGNFYINGDNLYVVDPFGSRITVYKFHQDQIKRRK